MAYITLYHGSPNILQKPYYGGGKAHNDYGLGFYCTEDIELAKEWSCTEKEGGFANQYALNTEGLTALKLNSTPYHILNWLSILLQNRTFDVTPGLPADARDYLLDNFLPEYQSFDIIVGYRADDSYFAFAKAFLNGTISLDQLRKAMNLGNLGEQVVLKSERAFQQLEFLNAVSADYQQYFARRRERDEAARREFQKLASASTAADSIYIIDILRQRWRNDDARLQ